MRESAVLGLPGAGGIGMAINSAMDLFQWERVEKNHPRALRMQRTRSAFAGKMRGRATRTPGPLAGLGGSELPPFGGLAPEQEGLRVFPFATDLEGAEVLVPGPVRGIGFGFSPQFQLEKIFGSYAI